MKQNFQTRAMVFDCCGPRGWQDQARRAAQRLPRSQGSSMHVAMLGKKVHVAPSRQFKHGTWGLERRQPVWLSTRQDDHLSTINPRKITGEPSKGPSPKKVGPMFLSSDIQNKHVLISWTCPSDFLAPPPSSCPFDSALVWCRPWGGKPRTPEGNAACWVKCSVLCEGPCQLQNLCLPPIETS